ncbi:helix-turn-helix domain-containing protein [Virgibacillus oceani]
MISVRLKYLRKKRNLSQQYMADFLGITRQGYGKYEDGKSEPDSKSIVKLADFFDVTTDYLLDHDTEDEDKRRNAIINKIATEFPDIDLMFKDIENWTTEDFEELYDYVKFKVSQKKKGD